MDFEFVSNQRVQIHSRGDRIAAKHRWRLAPNIKERAQFGINLRREEGDLAFVIRAVIFKPIALDSPTCPADDLLALDDPVLGGSFAVMSEIIVARRDVEVNDADLPLRVRGHEIDGCCR